MSKQYKFHQIKKTYHDVRVGWYICRGIFLNCVSIIHSSNAIGYALRNWNQINIKVYRILNSVYSISKYTYQISNIHQIYLSIKIYEMNLNKQIRNNSFSRDIYLLFPPFFCFHMKLQWSTIIPWETFFSWQISHVSTSLFVWLLKNWNY